MKKALITGASSGIGRAIAVALAKSGVEVYLVARREDKLRELALVTGGKYLALNVNDKDIASKLEKFTNKKIDILIALTTCI